MVGAGEGDGVGDEQHRGAVVIGGHRRFHRLPRDTLERGVANGLEVGLEAVCILRLCFGADVLPGLIVGEVRALRVLP